MKKIIYKCLQKKKMATLFQASVAMNFFIWIGQDERDLKKIWFGRYIFINVHQFAQNEKQNELQSHFFKLNVRYGTWKKSSQQLKKLHRTVTGLHFIGIFDSSKEFVYRYAVTNTLTTCSKGHLYLFSHSKINAMPRKKFCKTNCRKTNWKIHFIFNNSLATYRLLDLNLWQRHFDRLAMPMEVTRKI